MLGTGYQARKILLQNRFMLGTGYKIKQLQGNAKLCYAEVGTFLGSGRALDDKKRLHSCSSPSLLFLLSLICLVNICFHVLSSIYRT
ncbi:hypothetical protein ACJX0J_040024, partial [Zea mays]